MSIPNLCTEKTKSSFPFNGKEVSGAGQQRETLGKPLRATIRKTKKTNLKSFPSGQMKNERGGVEGHEIKGKELLPGVSPQRRTCERKFNQ